MMNSNSKENAPLTEKQAAELTELDKKAILTTVQATRRTELILKKEKAKEVILSDTCISYLVDAYAWETEKMVSITKEMDVEAFERGRKTEPESIELLSFVDDKPYVKNEYRFDNDFLSGIPDLLGFQPTGAPDTIKDAKSCKDLPMFLYKICKGVDPGNTEQLQGYGDILGITDLEVVFTLPTMPETIRNGYKWRLAQKMEEATTESPVFLRAWAELERSMIFDHIPPQKRVYKIKVSPFTTFEQEATYDRVKQCREWLDSFHTMYLKLNR